MAPSPTQTPSSSINYTAEWSAFIAKLTAYHRARGTHLDSEPRVGAKHVDLLQLFNAVVERGGYDRVSDEKLAWRKLGQDFNLGTNNLPALAFSLKTAYYKNLAAYEISTIHNQEPPPKDILEDVTAKGGGLLTRTRENYRASNRRETGGLGNEQSDDSPDGTPSREHGGSEEPGSASRPGRLRHAPPQRVIFQPDTSASRRSNPQPPAAMPTPPQPRGASTYNPPASTEPISRTVSEYEPRAQMPLTLRPVVTPSNNSVAFANRQRLLKEKALADAGHKIGPGPRMMLPGTGFDGPNIYVRCLLSLKSGIPAEQEYALHHLVKISMERGDKYRFESFLGLAEALVEKVLEITQLFYGTTWEISYADNARMNSTHTLDGIEGTPDILMRISDLIVKDVDDNIHTAEFSDKLLLINEAGLTIRNMVMLEENALYISGIFPLRDWLSIALQLPDLECVVELKHYAIEIAEQLTKYMHFDAIDPLYLSLIKQLSSPDRGAILGSLRAVSRISMNLEENNRLDGVPLDTLQIIIDYLLLDDEELVLSCLDFLYQYTAVVENVDYMVKGLDLIGPINQLVRLLSHGAVTKHREIVIKPAVRKPAPTQIPEVPKDLLDTLLKVEEPERSSQWLRCLFEEDKEEAITQIALWQAYQSRFVSAVQEGGTPLLPAADFIKNVSTTFAEKAAAQVMTGLVQKFIIRGIRIREVPVDLIGREYTRCQWNATDIQGKEKPCNQFFMGPEQMYNHLLIEHMGASKNEDGKFISVPYDHFVCKWGHCTRYRTATALTPRQCVCHIKTHTPVRKDPSQGLNSRPSWIEPAVTTKWMYEQGPIDERGDAAGIPLSAVLVLRNLARNMPKAIEGVETPGWTHMLFKPVEPMLFEILAHNPSLANYLTDLLAAIRGTY